MPARSVFHACPGRRWPYRLALAGLALASSGCLSPGWVAPVGGSAELATLEPTVGPAAAGQAAIQPSRPGARWGVHLLLDDGQTQWPVELWEEHLAYARALVGPGGYVVELIRADDLDVAKWQRFLDGAARQGLRPILRLATWQDRAAGAWVAPPKDEGGSTYRAFAGRLARFVGALRSSGQLDVIVGNEPNRGDEWGGRPDPAEYAQYLLDVSAALHAVGPGQVLVLNGALDQYVADSRGELVNGMASSAAADFMDGMQAANPRIWDAIDGWASHAYPLGPFSAPPAARQFQIDDLILGGPRTQDSPRPGLYNRGLNAYRWELYQLRSYGVTRDLPIFVTETGWRHRASQAPSVDAFGATLDPDQVAAYIRRAFDGDPYLDQQEYTWTPWAMDRDVETAVLFALDGDPARWGHTNLVDLRPDGSIIGLKPPFLPLLSRLRHAPVALLDR